MPRHSRIIEFLAPFILVAAACGGDGGGDTIIGPSVGPPASLTKLAGDAQTTAPSAALSVAPSVVVKDAGGNPVSGVTVAFTVATGGGTVSGGSAISNSSGVATVGGWTVGPIQGANTLTATVGSVAPATFTATATCPTTAYAFGANISGAVAASDCLDADGYYTDWYTVTLPTLAAGTAYTFTQTSAAFRSVIYAFLSTSPLNTTLANVVVAQGMSATQTTMDTKLILPAGGSYLLGITTNSVGATGAYTLGSAVTSDNATSSAGGICSGVWVIKGVTTTQTLGTTDCVYSGASLAPWMDTFVLGLAAGQTITVTMNSTVFDAYLALSRDPDFGAPVTIVATNDNRATGDTNAQIVYTATTDGYYMIRASSPTRATGSYTLIVQ